MYTNKSNSKHGLLLQRHKNQPSILLLRKIYLLDLWTRKTNEILGIKQNTTAYHKVKESDKPKHGGYT